jgi:hypothetical protein
MKPIDRFILFILLPIIAVLLYPPQVLIEGWAVIMVVVALFVLFGIILWRGNLTMLTFCIFLQGMNIITRSMMFFPHSVSKTGAVDIIYLVTNVISIVLSFYLLMSYDSNEFRLKMQQMILRKADHST